MFCKNIIALMCCIYRYLRSNMFLKILLVLAGSIQAFCFIRNSTRIYEKVPGGLEVGKVLKVQVWDPVLYPDFNIRFYPYQDEYAKDDRDSYLTVWFSRKTGILTIYSRENGVKRNVHKHYLAHQNSSHNLTVQILMEKDYFDIIASGRQFFHYHPRPIERISAFDVECEQVFHTFTTLWQRKFSPCPCGLVKTYVPKLLIS